MCSRSDFGGSSSISRANGVGRRRRRRGGRRSLTKNSQGSSPTWPSTGGGTAGGGEVGAPPRPPLPRAPRPRPRPHPRSLPLTAGSATAGAREGGMRCRAATLAATVEGPGFPLSMADGRGEQKLKEGGDEGMRDDIPPVLYKGMEWGLGRPLSQSRRGRRRELEPTHRPAPRRPGFPPPPLATPSAWEPHGGRARPKRRVRRPLPTP